MKYKSFSAMARGEKHILNEVIKQDYADHVDEDYQIAVISDGHGDANCFRSDKGAEIAVKICIEGFSEFAEQIMNDSYMKNELHIPKRREEYIQQLKTAIIGKWNLKVCEDIEKKPISDDILLENCDEEEKNKYLKGIGCNHIYGATLIGVIYFENHILVLHQGDGKCIFMDKNGEFSQPIPWDKRCINNVTTSLCDDDAVYSMRSAYLHIIDEDDAPAAIFVASDGIEDSYRTDDIMYSFYRELCMDFIEKDCKEVKKYLEEEKLPLISKEGSSDDMSVAGLIMLDKLSDLKDKFIQKNEVIIIEEELRKVDERINSMSKKREFLQRKCRESEEKKEQVKQRKDKLNQEKLQNKKDVENLKNNMQSKIIRRRQIETEIIQLQTPERKIKKTQKTRLVKPLPLRQNLRDFEAEGKKHNLGIELDSIRRKIQDYESTLEKLELQAKGYEQKEKFSENEFINIENQCEEYYKQYQEYEALYKKYEEQKTEYEGMIKNRIKDVNN